jgi:hypothetical protein
MTASTPSALSAIQPEFPPHVATNAGLERAAAGLGAQVEIRWLDNHNPRGNSTSLAWPTMTHCGARRAGPYCSLDGALRAIRFQNA